eukprot:Platyproteum_vivax@DN4267_c0_g1_i1.p1
MGDSNRCKRSRAEVDEIEVKVTGATSFKKNRLDTKQLSENTINKLYEGQKKNVLLGNTDSADSKSQMSDLESVDATNESILKYMKPTSPSKHKATSPQKSNSSLCKHSPAVTQCHHCEAKTCEECTASCFKCQLSFCKNCSISTYDERESLCSDCYNKK